MCCKCANITQLLVFTWSDVLWGAVSSVTWSIAGDGIKTPALAVVLLLSLFLIGGAYCDICAMQKVPPLFEMSCIVVFYLFLVVCEIVLIVIVVCF